MTNNLLLPLTKAYCLSYSDVAGPSRAAWFVPLANGIGTNRWDGVVKNVQSSEFSPLNKVFFGEDG